jgi:hypothetical protein
MAWAKVAGLPPGFLAVNSMVVQAGFADVSMGVVTL